MVEEDHKAASIDLSKHPSGIVPVVVNVVACMDLGRSLDLESICGKDESGDFKLDKQSPLGEAVMIRVMKPRTTALLFASGKILVTGARDEREAKSAAKKVNRRIVKLGVEGTKATEFRIVNIVAQSHCNFAVDLDKFSSEYSEYTKVRACLEARVDQ
jgi:transcription initiation factor TFIID TATA-box-binding protein